MKPERSDSLIGKIVGSYIVETLLGSGGMGEVYRARDIRLDRIVAVKVLPRNAADDPERLVRLEREAKLLASVNHPNICTIFEIGRHDSRPFIVMELVDGETLDRRIAARRLDAAEIFDIAVQVADALDTAHAKGIVHRDIKPSNLMITARDQAKVLDFGLAKISKSTHGIPSQDSTLHTLAGVLIGTIRYMSPEQALGREVDHRSDIFSLGVVLYEMATGHAPFEGSSNVDTINQIINAEPESVSRWNPEMPSRLQEIISRCLEKNREQRYVSAHDLLIDLREGRHDLVESRHDHRVQLPTISGSQVAERSFFGWVLSFFGINTPYRYWEVTQIRLGLLQAPFLVYFGWKFWTWTPSRWGLVFFLAEMTCVVALALERGLLLSAGAFRREDLSREIFRATPMIRWATVGLTLVLWTMAIMLADSHAGVAALLGLIGIVDLMMLFFFEPWVNNTAFPKNPE